MAAPIPHYHSQVPRALRLLMILALAGAAGSVYVAARPGQTQDGIDGALFGAMSWRLLGPFDGGRTTVVAGAVGRPHVFFAGTARGGVWKTTDAGHTWRPVFDDQPTGVIGSIAIAPSNPDMVFAGTGDAPLARRAAAGAGLFKSVDGGATWNALGLASEPHLTAILVDPQQPARLLVASAGAARPAGATAGIYRSTDGGQTFERAFATGAGAGALDLVFDPADASRVFATLVDWRDPAARTGTPTPLIVRSSDGGMTWTPADRGLPSGGDAGVQWTRIAAAPNGRLYAFVLAPRGGVFRSDDGANTWARVHAADAAPIADAAVVGLAADPSNAEVVYLLGRSVWRSVDGGRTFDVWRAGREGGLTRALWINPDAPAVSALATDHGALVSLNAGASWSAPDNQPTGEFVSIVTDAGFPFRVCAAAPATPTGCLPIRSSEGRAARADWQAVTATSGTVVAPDPQNADLIYTGLLGRFDRRTGQTQYVGPAPQPETASASGGPIVFASDQRTLYFGGQVLYRSAGGQNWSPISPNLSRGDGTISAIGPSPIDARVVWVGTDDGIVQVTRDAAVTWSQASPPALEAGWRVRAIEASHFDANTAYVVAADESGAGSAGVWRTRDRGATWQSISGGLPQHAVVNAVREDALRRGLLFAATDRSVFVSFDDGDDWQSMRLNLPPVPITDLAIKDTSLIVATGGRGLWVLDDVSAFRQLTTDVARADLFLFRPAIAWRTPPVSERAATGPAEPVAVNAPDGVTFTYIARSDMSPVRLEVIETVTGEVIRRFDDITAGDGLQRLVWDLRYAPVNGRAMWVMPGTYQVRLTAGARVARQAVIVRMDPRVRATASDLAAQFKASRAVDERRRAVAEAIAKLGPSAAASPTGAELVRSADALDRALDILQQADARPTPAAEAIAADALTRADAALARVP